MKIIDCFTFYNELDLLKYRLELLYDIIDYFIIVEATHTHVGYPKELYFEINKPLFKKYSDKIIHIIVDDFPYKQPNVDFSKNEQWRNENFQRNCISRGVQKLDLEYNDMIIISDLDEIPNPKILTDIKENKLITEAGTFAQHLYYYNLNSKAIDIWCRAAILRVSRYKEFTSCQHIRDTIFDRIEDGGWHLSYFGDKNHIQNKLKHFGHQELSHFANIEHIENCIKQHSDLFNRSSTLQYVAIADNNYLPPKYEIYLNKFYHD